MNALAVKAYDLRQDVLDIIVSGGGGHIGGDMSSMEIMLTLYSRMNVSPETQNDPDRDRFVLSKGHCSETLYTIFSDLGAYSMEYMIQNFECLDKSRFGMHTNRKYCPQIEVSAGSLGHGLSVALGMALAARKQKAPWNVFVMTGDGELDEGTNWEALMAAGHYQLGNLTLIVDKNGLQMTGPTAEVMNSDPLDEKLAAFGWDVRVIQDGNDMLQVCQALDRVPQADPILRRKPIALISKTEKGHGVDFMAGNVKWHGGGLGDEDYQHALACVEEAWERRKASWR